MKAGSASPIVADVLFAGLAVVDQQRDLHRVGGRRDRQNFARDLVFSHHEVGRAEIGDGRAALIEGAGVDRSLHGLGLERGGGHQR